MAPSDVVVPVSDGGEKDQMLEAGVSTADASKEGEAAEGEPENKFNKVWWMHVAAFFFMFIQAIAYGAVDVDLETVPTVGFMVSCNPATETCGGSWGSTPAVTWVGTQAPIWLMTFFVVLAAFDHLVTALYAYYYPENAKWWLYVAQSNPFRMIEYSVSASAMVWGITQLCGIHDVHLIMFCATGTWLGMLLGLVVELLPREDDPKHFFKMSTIKQIIWWLSAASIFIPWLVIFCYFFQSANRSPPPDFVYGAFLGTWVMFLTFGANSYCNKMLGWYDFERSEMIYIVLSFTAKTFLAADVFGGLAAASSDD